MARLQGGALSEVLEAATAEVAQQRIAAELVRRGLQAGDRLALVAEGSAAYVCATLGALRIGVVPVLLNPALLPAEQGLLLDDAEPATVLRQPDLAELAVLAHDEHAPRVDLASAPLARPMLYTSGTTGQPKGVWSGLLSEADALAAVTDEREVWAFAPDDRNLVVSPLYHSAPMRFAAGTLLAGGSVVLPGRFEPARVARAVAEHRPTTAFMAPPHLQRLFALGEDLDLRSFRLLAHAGAPCPDPLKREAIGRFPRGSVWEFYGSTEGQFTVCPAADWERRPGTVGGARPGRQLHLDEHGVIWCRPPAHARFSYWRDPERTARAWDGDWFTVGDLGRLDDDGFLYLDGRRDDLIISGGVNVYPVEVERALMEVPGVEAIAVFPVPDTTWGQLVCAAVVGDVDHGTLDRAARARLAPYKRPKRYVSVDHIATTATGKVRRGRLAAELGLT